VVEDGVYTGTGAGTACASNSRPIVCMTRGGLAGSPVTFRARNPFGAKLDGRSNQSTDGIRLIGQANYVTIEGFEIFGVGNSSGSASGIELYAAGHDSVITENDIHDVGRLCTDTTNGEVGIYVQQPNVTISRNRVHDMGRYAPGENGCQPSTPYYQNHDHGIYVNGSVSSGIPGGNFALIENNLFWNDGRGWAIQLYPGTLTGVRILSNTFAYPSPYQIGHIILAANLVDAQIVNNIFYSPRTNALYYYQGTATNVQVTNNIVYNATLMSKVPSGTLVTANQTGNPLLRDAANGDFHLTSSSMAINAGLALPDVTVDFDGLTRPAGASDIGAYQFTTGTLQTVAAPTISPDGGVISSSIDVTLTSTTAGSSIRYTTNGNTPDSASPIYSGAFSVSGGTMVKAQAFKDGMLDSAVSSAVFESAAAPDPAPSDVTPPSVSITSPGDQATVYGKVQMTAAASDDVGIVSVQFLLDGRSLANDTSAPYATSVNFNRVGAGSHVLSARAKDAAGNITTATVTVTRR